MPCFDPGAEAEYVAARSREAQKVEAMLCALMALLEDNGNLGSVLAIANWHEAGVTRKEAERWWADHKVQDAQRLAAEADYSRLEQARKSALEKLTPAEKIALGL